MIKTVLFDVDNTLLDFKVTAEEVTRDIFKRRGLDFHDNVMPTFFKVSAELWLQFEKGEIKQSEIYSQRFKRIFKNLDLALECEGFESEFVKGVFESAHPIKNSFEILEYLKDKYSLYIVSNASHPQQINRLKICGMLPFFKDVFTSDRIGYSKPDVRFLDECFKEIGNVDLSEVLLVGDSLTADISLGKAAKIKTCLFNRDKKEVDPNSADYIIEDLIELKNIL